MIAKLRTATEEGKAPEARGGCPMKGLHGGIEAMTLAPAAACRVSEFHNSNTFG